MEPYKWYLLLPPVRNWSPGHFHLNATGHSVVQSFWCHLLSSYFVLCYNAVVYFASRQCVQMEWVCWGNNFSCQKKAVQHTDCSPSLNLNFTQCISSIFCVLFMKQIVKSIMFSWTCNRVTVWVHVVLLFLQPKEVYFQLTLNGQLDIFWSSLEPVMYFWGSSASRVLFFIRYN